MSAWSKARLSEISVLITKGTTPTTLGYKFTERGVNFVKSESIGFDGQIDKSKFAFIDETTHQSLSRSIIAERDILFSMAGVYLGKTAVVPKEILPANTNQAVGIIRLDRSKAEPRFIDYLIRNKSYNLFLNNLVAQSAQPNFNLTEIRNLPISLPSLSEQRAIASVLGALDDKIELNRRMNETLETLAQSLFKSWFVDATQSTLPKGWTTRPLYDCADYINGAAFRNEHFSAERQGLPVIKIGELKDGITAQTKFCEMEREPKYRINSGDILFSWSGSPDTSIDIFIWTEGEGWLNQHIFKIQFKRPIEKFFVYYLLRHLKPVFIELARDKQTTGLGHVTGQDLKRLKTFFPTDDVLEKFNRVVEPLFQKVYFNLHESRTLAALRDALLPKLLSGELRVPSSKIEKGSHV